MKRQRENRKSNSKWRKFHNLKLYNGFTIAIVRLESFINGGCVVHYWVFTAFRYRLPSTTKEAIIRTWLYFTDQNSFSSLRLQLEVFRYKVFRYCIRSALVRPASTIVDGGFCEAWAFRTLQNDNKLNEEKKKNDDAVHNAINRCNNWIWCLLEWRCAWNFQHQRIVICQYLHFQL